jgi:hypothetical protein
MHSLEHNQEHFASFREHLASFREHLASFREHLASFREHLASFREYLASLRGVQVSTYTESTNPSPDAIPIIRLNPRTVLIRRLMSIWSDVN